jgi:hypothetical protein
MVLDNPPAMVRLKTAQGVIVRVDEAFAQQLIGNGYKPVGGGSRRRADTAPVATQPAPPPAPAPVPEPAPVAEPVAAPARNPREPDTTTAELEQQLLRRRSRSADQR